MQTRLSPEPFDPAEALSNFAAGRSDVGAEASFVGRCRDVTDGRAVTGLRLDHYPGFTERALQNLAEEAAARWKLLDVLLIHRVGLVIPGEPIVLAAAAAAHRAAALEAVCWLMDHLKTDAPFWKREEGPDGARWIEPRPEDHAARESWAAR